MFLQYVAGQWESVNVQKQDCGVCFINYLVKFDTLNFVMKQLKKNFLENMFLCFSYCCSKA